MSRDQRAVTGLNENHLRRVYATCLHVDALLKTIEGVLTPPARTDLFHRYQRTLSDATRLALVGAVHAFRDAIAGVIRRFRITLPPPGDDRFVIASTLEFVESDIIELQPQHMGGYGELSQEGRSELDALVDEFSTHLAALRRILDEDSPQDAAGRRRGRD